MSGKLCDGEPLNAPYLRDSKAYCDGRAYAAGGGLVGDDPHNGVGEDSRAWIAGFNSHTADPAGVIQDCCANAYGAGYTPP